MSAKTIGIVGGMGPEATLALYGEIIRATPARIDQEHLRVIIDSNPKIPDRTPAIFGKGEDPVPAMAFSCRAVEKAGADFVIIPCISAHFFIEALQQQVRLPILSAFDAVSDHIAGQHPDMKSVGLLATSGTVSGGRFAERLSASGIAAVAPGNGNQALLMEAIYKIKGSLDPAVRADCKAGLLSAAADVIGQGAGGIIAGCTEIPLELAQEDLAVPFFNSLEILAAAAVKHAVSGA